MGSPNPFQKLSLASPGRLALHPTKATEPGCRWDMRVPTEREAKVSKQVNSGIRSLTRVFRQRPGPAAWSLASLALAILAGCSSGGGTTPTGPIQLIPGATIGRSVFPEGDTAQGGQGQAVDGISAGIETVTYHVHAHLSLFVNGEQLAIPANIGILQNGNTFTFYTLHCHDATGIIHVEAAAPATFTLSQFFDIWGEPLSSTGAAGHSGTVTTFVDGAPFTGDPRTIELTAHRQITLEVGTPVITPPVYLFPTDF
jgi:hypothetical protein